MECATERMLDLVLVTVNAVAYWLVSLTGCLLAGLASVLKGNREVHDAGGG